MRRSIRIVGGLIGLLFVLACVAWSVPKQPVPVSILMPAPYADASTQLVEAFNREHRGTIQLEVIRGPLETESISDFGYQQFVVGGHAL